MRIEKEVKRNRHTLDHSVFLMQGSSHSYQRALHCFGVFLTRRDEIRALVGKIRSDSKGGEGLIPLVFAILYNGGLEDLVLGVLDWMRMSERKPETEEGTIPSIHLQRVVR